MKKTLVIHGHRKPDSSQFGRALFEHASQLAQVSGHTLMQEYPDFKIDVALEQQRLTQHQALVLQFPFYWYSSPAIVKEWLDAVLERGWAYGGGQALAGKKFMVATSTGGPEMVYQQGGANRHTIDEFLAPFEQTARLCGMVWHKPFVMYGVRYLDNAAIAKCGADYQRRIEALTA